MPLIPAFHEVFGLCLVPESRVRLHPGEWSTYDPGAHRAADVVDHLHRCSPLARARVLALERAARRPRKTVLAVAGEIPAEPTAAVSTTVDPASAAGEPTTRTGAHPGDLQED